MQSFWRCNRGKETDRKGRSRIGRGTVEMVGLHVVRRHLKARGRMHDKGERPPGVAACRNDSDDTHREADIVEEQVWQEESSVYPRGNVNAAIVLPYGFN